MPLGGAQLADGPQRSFTTMPSVGTPRHVGLHVICDRNFRKFIAAVRFCSQNRVRSRRNPCRSVVRSLLTALRGPRQLCRASARRGTWHCVRFSADFRPKFSNIFRGSKILHSKSREIAQKLLPLGGTQLADGPQRSTTTMATQRRHTAARGIACDFRSKFSKNLSRP